jgi:hypothetical protein
MTDIWSQLETNLLRTPKRFDLQSISKIPPLTTNLESYEFPTNAIYGATKNSLPRSSLKALDESSLFSPAKNIQRRPSVGEGQSAFSPNKGIFSPLKRFSISTSNSPTPPKRLSMRDQPNPPDLPATSRLNEHQVTSGLSISLPFLAHQSFEEDQEIRIASVRSQLVNHLTKHLPNEDRSKLWTFAMEYSRAQLQRCLILVHLVWKVTIDSRKTQDVKNEYHEGDFDEIDLLRPTTPIDHFLFTCLEHLLILAQDYSIPLPSGCYTLFSFVAFQCLETHVFHQYLANGAVRGKFHDQGDAEWIVIRGQLKVHNDMPFGQTTPGRLIGRPGLGRP